MTNETAATTAAGFAKIAQTDLGMAIDQLTTAHYNDQAGEFAVWNLGSAVEKIEAALRHAVVIARQQGTSWAVIGEALGVSKQAAQQKYGRYTG